MNNSIAVPVYLSPRWDLSDPKQINNLLPCNWASGKISTLLIHADMPARITGLSRPGEDRYVVNIINLGSMPFTLLSQSASSTAMNRFGFSWGKDLVVSPLESVFLIYCNCYYSWREMNKGDLYGEWSYP